MSATTESLSEPKCEDLTSVEHPLLVFFDGECGFCNHWVNQVMAADHEHRIRFGTKQGKTFQRVAQAHPEVAKVESIVVLSRNALGQEDVLVRSSAVRMVIEELPAFHFFALLLQLIPTPLCDLGYRIFSKVRTPLFGRLAQCRVPTKEERKLFVD